VNVVGDMATWHAGSDASLCMEIAGLARTVSGCVVSATTADNVAQDAAVAVAATKVLPTALASRVGTCPQ
jgi:hypothetical protein